MGVVLRHRVITESTVTSVGNETLSFGSPYSSAPSLIGVVTRTMLGPTELRSALFVPENSSASLASGAAPLDVSMPTTTIIVNPWRSGGSALSTTTLAIAS